MDRKFLLTVSAACGALILVCILLLPMASHGEMSMHFVQADALGIVFTLVGIAGAGHSILLFLGKAHLLGLEEGRAVNAAFASFALAAFLGLATIVAGTDGLGIGFWLFWLANLAGGFATLLTANPALARKIAEAAKEKSTMRKDDDPGAGSGAGPGA